MFSTVEEGIEAIARGEMIIVTDDSGRENEGDLIMATEKVTPEAINFMATHGRGLICAPITVDRAAQLRLLEMPGKKDRYGTAFTFSIDAKEGTTTGISAYDRAVTAKMLVNPEATHDDFYIPGHLFPLIAKDGGVLERPGHTETAIDLARLAGFTPAGVICEIMAEDGTMACGDQIVDFAKTHGLKLITVEDLVTYRKANDPDPMPRDKTIRRVDTSGRVSMPSRFTDMPFDLHGYVSRLDGTEHVALVYGDVTNQKNVLVRVHSECLTGDVLHSARCDCGEQLDLALTKIVEEGKGVLVYLKQEGRGIGLVNKIRAYALQDKGMDTVEANVELGFEPDLRCYKLAAEILEDLKVESIRLMTNNPDKVSGLEENGTKILERIPIVIDPREPNKFYLETKRKRMGHIL
jgi:3,4-dihydroxy 2-butanone 4-phosphate synthase/GTP cyclohydrolase II